VSDTDQLTLADGAGAPPGDVIARRLARLRAGLAERQLDAFVALKLVNTYYLSGFASLDTARPTSYTRPMVVVVDAASACLIIPRLDEEPAKAVSAVRDIRVYATSPVVEAAQQLCLERLRELGVSRVGIEEDTFTAQWLQCFHAGAPTVELVPAGDCVRRLRIVKDATEVGLMRAAGKLSHVAITASLAASGVGVTELEAETHGLLAFRRAASEDDGAIVDCVPIVLSGPRGSMPHEFTSAHPFTAGEPMWHCWLTSYHGYWTENIRSGVVGRDDGGFRDVFRCLTDGLLAGQEAARPGRRANEVFDAIVSELTRATYPDAVVLTRAGHGMGLEYHEPPFVEASDTTVLAPGMVVTVEPGIWIPGTGGFTLSNTLVIGTETNEILTPTSLDPYSAA
jgi:Xaa-Pro dipeptidase